VRFSRFQVNPRPLVLPTKGNEGNEVVRAEGRPPLSPGSARLTPKGVLDEFFRARVGTEGHERLAHSFVGIGHFIAQDR
jgi:hypothetical protein